jgi:L-ascorbate metabolism protein UlaG (beta-lactamase superfamily)
MENLKRIFQVLLIVFGAGVAGASSALAADRACLHGLVMDQDGWHINPLPVSTQLATIPKHRIDVSYIGHSTFLVETPKGATVATDYNGFIVPKLPPMIVTMNNYHESHYTDQPNPLISHVLRGWDPGGGLAKNDIKVRDLRVYSIPTNMTNFDGKWTNDNSIFVMEASGICLAHVGHLHHVLSKNQIHQLGKIDIAFMPIGGFSTLSHEEAIIVIDQINAKVVIPMHYHFAGSGEEFEAIAKAKYLVKWTGKSHRTFTKRSLPKKTEVMFLNPSFGNYNPNSDDQ